MTPLALFLFGGATAIVGPKAARKVAKGVVKGVLRAQQSIHELSVEARADLDEAKAKQAAEAVGHATPATIEPVKH